MEENKELLELLQKVEKTNRQQVRLTRLICVLALIAALCQRGYDSQLVLALDTTNQRLRAYNSPDMGLDYILTDFIGMMKGLGLSVIFLAIGAGLALLITGTLSELVVILTITTLSIIASFFKPVRELPKTFELGMFFILIFSVIVASMFNIHSVSGGSLYIGGFVLWIMGISVLLHLILCRIAKVSGDLFCVCQVGLLCSPPFVPPIAGAMKNKKVLISGIVVGLVGYAVGTYIGAILAWVLSLV